MSKKLELPALLVWVSLLIVNWSEIQANILSNERDIRKRQSYSKMLMFLQNSKWKKGHNYVKKFSRVTCPTGMVPLLIVNN